MYLNNTLIRIEVTETDVGMGYTKKEMIETAEIYAVDRQPYSSVLAKKQYGLAEEGIIFRCYTKKKGLQKGDYVSCGGSYYLVLLVNDWENHSEIILGVFKDG